jgi:pilus assembly protein CpaB
MNRRTRHLIVLLVAVVTAAIASFGVFRAMGQLPAQADQMQSVVVAARPLVIGSQLTEKDIKLVAWPASSLVPGAITDVKDALNRGLLVAVMQNEPLTTDKVASAESGVGLPPAIPQGMRAMSVRVNDVIGVAGFIAPGSRVDVVVTIRRSQDSMTRTAASNVQVLTAGTRKDQQNPQTETSNSADRGETVVTLMVTPGDAERIALAQSEGQIMLVLRNPLDTATVATTGVKTGALFGAEETPVPAAAPAPAQRRVAAPRKATPPPAPDVVAVPPPAPRTVEAIRAAKRTDEVIK